MTDNRFNIKLNQIRITIEEMISRSVILKIELLKDGVSILETIETVPEEGSILLKEFDIICPVNVKKE